MQRLIAVVVVAVLFMSVPSAQSRKLTERARQARTKPGTPPVVVGVFGDIAPWTLEQLTEHSDVVIDATLTQSESYIDSTDEAVFTDFTIVSHRVLKGTVPERGRTPGAPVSPRLTMYGGEVMIDGVAVRAVSHNQRALRSGRYLLFLKPFGSEPARYQLVNGAAFELRGDVLTPTVYNAGKAYADFTTMPYASVAARITALAR
jgi:hypothetical protein